MSELGPTITQIKKFAESGTFVSPNISVNFQNAFAVWVYGFPEENPFSGPIYLTKSELAIINQLHGQSTTAQAAQNKDVSNLKACFPLALIYIPWLGCTLIFFVQ
jgi:hypothetical protein